MWSVVRNVDETELGRRAGNFNLETNPNLFLYAPVLHTK